MESDEIKKLLVFFLILIFIQTASASTISGSGYTSGYGEGYYVHYSFYNYCPLCGGIDCLDTYVKGVNEITCLHCDADYSYSGRDKYGGGARAWLTPYYKPKAEPVPEPDPIPEPEVEVPTNTTIETHIGSITLENKHLETLKLEVINKW